MYDAELGVKSPCFGDYRCPDCNRKWESAVAWRDYGQMCKSCNKSVLAEYLQPLYFYYCDACFLESNGENGKWKYKYCKEGSPCRTCGEMAKPCDRRSLYVIPDNLRNGGFEDSPSACDLNKQHQRKLCQKCRWLGRYCGNRWEEEEERLRTMEEEAKKGSYRSIDEEAKEKNWSVGTIKLAKFIRALTIGNEEKMKKRGLEDQGRGHVPKQPFSIKD